MADEVKKVDKDESEDAAENEANESKKIVLANIRKIFWVAIAILILLLIFSIVVLAARMYKYAKLADDGRILNIAADSVENFDIFSAEYKNDSGEITVESANGDSVIAPGTGTEYTIRIRNKDDVAIDYEFDPAVEYVGDVKFPIEVRLISPTEEYLIGSAKEDAWAHPQSEQLACVAASPAFKNGFECENRFAEVGDEFFNGDIGYHMRKGTHYFSREDWQKLIRFVNAKK